MAVCNSSTLEGEILQEDDERVANLTHVTSSRTDWAAWLCTPKTKTKGKHFLKNPSAYTGQKYHLRYDKGV